MFRKWIILTWLVFILVSCDASHSNEVPSLSANTVFHEVEMDELGELLHPVKVEGLKGRDQMIRAQGTFTWAQREQVAHILQGKGFEQANEFLFATGDDDPWWSVVGGVRERIFHDRQRPGRESKMKLLKLNDGSGFFQFEQVDM